MYSSRCFCGSTVDPKPPRLAIPHSCGNPCSRTRKCGHPCPIACHPGPCPPCKVTTRLRCHCTSKMLSFKCSNISSAEINGDIATDLSCGNICSRKLGCGNHTCKSICHPGDCKACEVKKGARCYCGKEETDIGCGEGSTIECEADDEEKWMGLFACNTICARRVSTLLTFHEQFP
jgi:transcriptional repressor NF-X1